MNTANIASEGLQKTSSHHEYRHDFPQFSPDAVKRMAEAATVSESFTASINFVLCNNFVWTMRSHLTRVNMLVASAGVCGISENSLIDMENCIWSYLVGWERPKGVHEKDAFDPYTYMESRLTLEQKTWLFFFCEVQRESIYSLCGSISKKLDNIFRNIANMYGEEDSDAS